MTCHVEEERSGVGEDMQRGLQGIFFVSEVNWSLPPSPDGSAAPCALVLRRARRMRGEGVVYINMGVEIGDTLYPAFVLYW